jgi:hypothetical protein
VVTGRSFEALVKSEAKAEARKIASQEEQKRGALFSNYLAHNMGQHGAREKPQGTPSFATLRSAAKHSFVDAIVIRARIDQVKRIWQRTFTNENIGFRVVHERHDDPDFKGSKDIDGRCREMEALIMDPTPDKYTTFYPHRIRPHARTKDIVAVLTKAELVVDRKVIRRLKRADGKGYAAFHWLPGDTIKNVDEAVREWARKNEPDKKIGRYTQERMSYATGFDIARCSHVQVIDGMVSDAFYPEEISVHISNPSDELNRYGYGESRLEISLDVTATLMYAWNFNKELFKTNYPEQILTVAGDFDKEGLQAFKQSLLAETHGSGNYHRLPIIPSSSMDNFKVEAHKLRDTPKDMLFDQFVRLLIMIKLSAYGAHASTLNLSTDSGGGGAMFGHNPSDEIEFSQEKALIPSVTDMCEWWTDALIKPRYDDLKLIVVGLEKEDEKQAVDIRTSRVSKWITKNEARMEEGKHPIGFMLEKEKYDALGEDDPDRVRHDQNPWNFPADVPITNYLGTFAMANQDGGEEGLDSEGGPGDDGDEEWQDQDADQYYGKDEPQGLQKSRRTRDRKPRRQRRYLEIEIGD